uniref:histone acetyltransferase n=1 Tax=Toxoplasma gondii COUG TaxID=1074873 RepID=A0A2G8Y621_TOXGO|nr:histone lysine acetyltransferase GCN5-B [Toxoplasma gondii COUG]
MAPSECPSDAPGGSGESRVSAEPSSSETPSSAVSSHSPHRAQLSSTQPKNRASPPTSDVSAPHVPLLGAEASGGDPSADPLGGEGAMERERQAFAEGPGLSARVETALSPQLRTTSGELQQAAADAAVSPDGEKEKEVANSRKGEDSGRLSAFVGRGSRRSSHAEPAEGPSLPSGADGRLPASGPWASEAPPAGRSASAPVPPVSPGFAFPSVTSCLPLNASIGDIALRLVKEILQPVLARDIQVDPPSPFRFTASGMAKALELSPVCFSPAYAASLRKSYAQMGTAGSCFYCVSAPCVCGAFAPPLAQARPAENKKRGRDACEGPQAEPPVGRGPRRGPNDSGAPVGQDLPGGPQAPGGPGGGFGTGQTFQDNLRQMCLFHPYSSVPPPKLIDMRYLCLFLSASADSPFACATRTGLCPFFGDGPFGPDGETRNGREGPLARSGDKVEGEKTFLSFVDETADFGDASVEKGFPDHARIGWEVVEEVAESLEAIFNTIQMETVEDRRDALTVPDEFYAQNYWEWRQFLLDKAPTGASVSRTFGRSLLRSLLLASPGTIAKDLQRTPISFAAGILFFRLCEEVGIEPETRHVLWRTVASSQPELRSRLVSESGLGFLCRDLGSAKEEEAGLITFKCVTNDRQPFSSRALVTVKNIFSRQLPKMPREYIVRLVFDRNHYTFCLNKEDTIIGGCCFRPYFQQKFAEIAFLAVTSTEQVKGYGTRLMNHLKEHVKKSGIEYFLTYADNFAVGYFRKQGFTQKISMPRERWYGYIKDYEGGTLMECHINPRINYLRLSEMLHDQQQVIKRATVSLKPLAVYPGLDFWKKNPGQTLSPSQIPGLLQCGWHPGEGAPRAGADGKGISEAERAFLGSTGAPDGAGSAGVGQGYMRPLHEQIMDILDALGKHHSAWPFLKPVSREEAPDYYDVILQPTDISTMKKKCKKKHYTTAQMFADEVQLMFKNCRQYNHQQTIYYKYANELDKFVTPKIQALKQAFQQQQKQLAQKGAASGTGVPPLKSPQGGDEGLVGAKHPTFF